MKRPAARARRLSLEETSILQRASAAGLSLDERLNAIVASVKNLPVELPRPRTLDEEMNEYPTSDLLHILFKLDARECTDVRDIDEIERLRAVRAEIDHRIPRRRA